MKYVIKIIVIIVKTNLKDFYCNKIENLLNFCNGKKNIFNWYFQIS